MKFGICECKVCGDKGVETHYCKICNEKHCKNCNGLDCYDYDV